MQATLGKGTRSMPMKTENTRVQIQLARWQRHARGWMSAWLFCSDLAAFALSGFLAIAARWLFRGDWSPGLLWQALPVAFFCLLVYALRGLYPAVGLSPVEELRRLTTTTSVVVLSLAALTFFARNPEDYSRLNLGLTWAFSLVSVPLGRALTRSLGVRLGIWGEPVAVIGAGDQARQLLALLEENPRFGFRPAVILAAAGDDNEERDLPLIALKDMLLKNDLSRSTGVKTALLLLAETLPELVDAFVRERRGGFRRLILVPKLTHVPPFGVTAIHMNGILGLAVHHNLLNKGEQFLKRVLDIFWALLGILVLSPFLGLIALLIKLDSQGSVFYSQIRVGRNGKLFPMLKFRTMHCNADQVLESYLARDPALRQEWQQFQKLRNDPRITRLGHYLRKYSLDELPQLWNVLKGEMSLVGPRPFFPEQRELYGDQGYVHYACVRPGITGMWQVSGRNQAEFTDRPYWDEYYVRNWSIWLDLYILARTVWVVLRREGAY